MLPCLRDFSLQRKWAQEQEKENHVPAWSEHRKKMSLSPFRALLQYDANCNLKLSSSGSEVGESVLLTSGTSNTVHLRDPAMTSQKDLRVRAPQADDRVRAPELATSTG